MSTATTRRHHHVWRKYLASWAHNGKLWCLNKGSEAPFQVNPKNVAVERDFYRFQGVTEKDVAFIKKLAIEPTKIETLRELNQGWLSQFGLLSQIGRYVREDTSPNGAAVRLLDELFTEVEEKYHAMLESVSTSYLNSLIAGDASFMDDDKCAVEFSYFLSQQYFRTRAMRDRTIDDFPVPMRATAGRIWPVLRTIFATNVAFWLYANRQAMKWRVLECHPGMEFITGDQPVVNTYAAFVSTRTPIEKLEFYYPISPARGLIISDHSLYANVGERVLGSFRTKYFNLVIERAAQTQLFAGSSDGLSGARFGTENLG